MKRFLSCMICVLLLLTCLTACGDDVEESSSAPASSDVAEDIFTKPDNYASVITVTINPTFRLYLDASGIVLAMEAVNDDAKAMEKAVSFKKANVGTVVKQIVVAAKDKGYLQEKGKVEVQVVEVTQEVTDRAVLNMVTQLVNNELERLDMEVELATSMGTTTVATTTTTTEATASEDTSTATATDSTASKVTGTMGETTSSATKKPTTSATTQKPACKHPNTKAVAVSTGANIIDASKLDVIHHRLQCKDCGAVVKTEKHTVKDGKCTVCGQANLAVGEVSAITAGISLPGNGEHGETRIRADGVPDFDIMLQVIAFDAMNKGEWVDEWTSKIPEAVVLEALRKRFVISDSLFATLKQQGKYDFYFGNQEYENGYFVFRDPAAGGPGSFSHDAVAFKDDGKGTFTVYFDYLLGGPDVEANEREHVYYYAVEYTYVGASNLSLDKDEYGYGKISGWKAVVESLRVKSIKKVADLSGTTDIG